MFVRAFSQETDEELAQLVSESFIVSQLSSVTGQVQVPLIVNIASMLPCLMPRLCL